MLGVEDIATAFCKFTMVDANFAKYKPSILAASFVFVGFQI